MALPGDFFVGPPRNRVEIVSFYDSFETANVVRNFVNQELPSQGGGRWGQFLDPSATIRTPAEIRISRTHLRVGHPTYDIWPIDTSFSDLGWSRGIVQFAQHSYSPGKSCVKFNLTTRQFEFDAAANELCPNTWHWDTFGIQPSVPFMMVKADRRQVTAGNPSITLDSPAPANGHLRFGAVGTNMEVSFDGGATWQRAQQQQNNNPDDSRWQSYWHPIPAGTTTVRFRAQDHSHAWAARDVSVFSLAGSQPPLSPTPVPLTSTPTPVPPTSTPVPPTPTVQPTGTPAPSTMTPTPSPAPSPAPGCEVRVRIGGVESWLPKPAAFCQEG
jgi:hypothetical protein